MEKKAFQKKLGKHIIRLRERQNLSQSDLARACEKDRQSIERIENGKTNPTAHYLFQIAQALKINPKEIFNFDSKD